MLRCQEENLRLERMWQENLHGRAVATPSQLQIIALAGEFYRKMVETRRENPGRPIDWEQALRPTNKRRGRPLASKYDGYRLQIHSNKGARSIRATATTGPTASR